MRQRGLTVGRLDGRFQTYVLDRPEVSPDWDATDSAIDGAFIATGNYYLQQVLKYNPPLLYRSEIYDLIYADGSSWDFKHGNNPQNFNVAPDLAQTMTLEPRMKVFSANGYFDFATPFFATQYVLSHLDLNPALQRNISLRVLPIGPHGVSASRPHWRSSTPTWNAGTLRCFAKVENKRVNQTLRSCVRRPRGGTGASALPAVAAAARRPPAGSATAARSRVSATR